jgi:hypothetical protein
MLGLSGNQKRFSKFLENTLGHLVNRVRLLDRLITSKYNKLVSCMDVVLDSYPFGGCNTTLDSFNFNKVVVTLPSDKINGRFTLGFYKKMNILEPVASNIDDFVNKAYEFASNETLRTQIENKIKDNKQLLFEEQASIDTWKEMLFNICTCPCTLSKKDFPTVNQLSDIDPKPIVNPVIDPKPIVNPVIDPKPTVNPIITQSINKPDNQITNHLDKSNISNQMKLIYVINPNLNPNPDPNPLINKLSIKYTKSNDSSLFSQITF